MMNLKTKTKENSGNRQKIAVASTGQNGQLIRIHPTLNKINSILIQNQEKSPPGRSLGPHEHPAVRSTKIKEKIIQKNCHINSYHI